MIEIEDTVDAEIRTRFVLPISAGLRLPMSGTQENSVLLLYQVTASQGMIPWTAIVKSEYVNTIPSGSKIKYDPNIPGLYMNVEFQFTPLAPREPWSPPCMQKEVAFQPGDIIILTLPTFTVDVEIRRYYLARPAIRMDPFGQNKTAVAMKITTHPFQVFSEALWFDDSKLLVFQVKKPLVSNELVKINIESGCAMKSLAEVVEDNPDHILSAIIDGFRTPPVPLQKSMFIKSFGIVVTSGLTFDPPSSLLLPHPPSMSIKVHFAVNMNLMKSDFIDFFLPGFKSRDDPDALLHEDLDCWDACRATGPCSWCGTGMCCQKDFVGNGCDGVLGIEGKAVCVAIQHIKVLSEPVICYENPQRCEGKIREATWFKSQSRLMLRIQQDMVAYENVTVLIPNDAGLLVPEYGINSDMTSLKMKAQVVAGILQSSSIQDLQPIGYFRDALSIEYSVPSQDEALSLSVSMIANLEFFKDDVVSILMSGFDNTESSSAIVPVEPTCALAKASWKDRRLNVTFGSRIKRFDRRTIQIPKDLGIKIPNAGISLALPETLYPTFKSDVKNTAGLVKVQSSGKIFDTRLCVSKSIVSSPIKIKVLFNMSIPLVFDDIVSIHLPNFYATSDPHILVLGMYGSLFSSPRLGCDVSDDELVPIRPFPIASWNAETNTLQFLIAANVEPFTYCHFVLENYLEIGKMGLRTENDPDYLISLTTQVLSSCVCVGVCLCVLECVLVCVFVCVCCVCVWLCECMLSKFSEDVLVKNSLLSLNLTILSLTDESW